MTSFLARLLAPRSAPVEDAPQSATVVAGAEPYHSPAELPGGGRVGVLLLHGFTGSPRSMRAWAEHLEADGFRVAVPRLPGHGTSWPELALTEWPDWYACALAEFRDLQAACDRVFVCGLSMGGSLALLLAERLGDQISGVVLVNAAVTSTDKKMLALPLLRRFVATIPGISNDIARPGVDEGAYDRTPLRAAYSMSRMWREIHDGLSRITQPLLIFRSVVDHVVDPSSGRAILAAVGSTDVFERLLPRSYHVATMDFEAEEIFAESSTFFRRLSKD